MQIVIRRELVLMEKESYCQTAQDFLEAQHMNIAIKENPQTTKKTTVVDISCGKCATMGLFSFLRFNLTLNSKDTSAYGN